jgi:hypothetical protein
MFIKDPGSGFFNPEFGFSISDLALDAGSATLEKSNETVAYGRSVKGTLISFSLEFCA